VLTPGAALRVVQQVLVWLRRAHLLGILHRDVRPSNIIECSTNGTLSYRLADWGLAVQCPGLPPVHEDPCSAAPVGVLHYASSSLLHQYHRHVAYKSSGFVYKFTDDLEAPANSFTTMLSGTVSRCGV
jgi:serine/threonine protein kinase